MPKVVRRVAPAVRWLLVVAGVGAIGLFALRPYRAGPKQPIPFSHHRHAAIRGISCFFCHSGADRSAVAGLPPIRKCLLCHNVVAQHFGPIQKLHDAYDSGKPIPWVRVYRLPDFAHFNHQAHIAHGVDCGHCHGDVKSMNRIVAHERVKMAFCVGCHRRPEYNASVDCLVCHR